jgi:predicted dehydrogenase
MRLAIIGCGLIGRKRAIALGPDDKLLACCDTNEDSARKFADEFKCKYYIDHNRLISETDLDAAIVAVVNKYAKGIIVDCLRSGRHVLAEKPLGRNVEEAVEILVALQASKSSSPRLSPFNNLPILPSDPTLKTGFNHRFHPAVWKAKELADAGEIGKVFSIRAIYGHGGRPGMENEWRASKDLCGGGELLDQGVHVIDLVRWFGGEVKEVSGIVETKYWEMEVEDNAYAILKTERDVTASIQVSWTNWRNIFLIEIFGTDGYLKVSGLGGSYGDESLEIGKRKKEGGKPDIRFVEFPTGDISWKEEWKEFKSAISENREPIGDGYDGLRANQVIEAIYRSSREGKKVFL